MVTTYENRAAIERAEDFDPGWIKQHVLDERRQASALGQVREAVFGAQDGLMTTLATVSTVGGATHSTFPVLVAGLGATLAGMFSMAVGEYIGSKSQREIYEAQIAGEELEVEERPAEAEAEVAYMLEEEGLSRAAALRVAREIAHSRPVLLRTMVEKELGLEVEDATNALRGAIVMGLAFGAAALMPVLPYLFLPVERALVISVGVTVIILFGMGVVKSRWTRRGWLPSGAEMVVLGAIAGVAGYFFGELLPALLGVAGVAG